MTGYWYDAYGLKFCSQLQLAIPPSKPGKADVTVRLGKVLDAPIDRKSQKCTVRVSPEEICCHWSPAGTYSIRNGNEIVIEPDEGADEETLAAWFQGAALSLILHQRGHFAL